MPEQFFQTYLAGYTPFKSYWNYEDGCVLNACRQMYQATNNRIYADFVLQYLSERIAEDGSIRTYPAAAHSLDSFHCGKSLFFAYQLTNEPRYRKAAEWQAAQIQQHPRTKSGFCWHKQIYPQQIWIDGLYMTEPFFAEYALGHQNPRIYSEIGRRFAFVEAQMRQAETGLYYHGLDESRSQIWADKETGLSDAFWLRGEGWLLMALTDTILLLPDSQAELFGKLTQMLKNAVRDILPFRASDGLFYQVIDQPQRAGNYTETSGSCMIAYTLLRGGNAGIFDAKQQQIGLEILEDTKKLKLRDNRHCDICSAAGLGGANMRDGSAAYYLSEPIVQNDPKGVASMMLAEAQRLMMLKMKQNRRKVV